MIKLSLKYLKQYFFAVLGAVILVVLQSYGQIVLVMGEMRVILEKGVKASDMSVVRASSVNMILYTLLLGLCAIGLSYLTSKVAGNLFGRLRMDCFNKVLSMRPEKYDSYGVSSLLTRTVNDPKAIVALLQFMVSRVIILPVTLCCILIVTFITSREIFMVFLISLLVSIVVLTLFRMVSQKYYDIYQKLIDRFAMTIDEKITGVRTIRAFGCESQEEKKGMTEDQKIMKAAIRANRPLCLMNTAAVLVLDWTSVVIYLVSANEIRNGILSVNNLVFIFQYLSFSITILSLIPSLVKLLPRAIVSTKRVLELLDEEQENEKEFQEEFPVKDGTIEFRDVSFRYKNGRNVLSHVDFTVRGKETLAIVGATGSGKTTLLQLILGLYDHFEGEILIDGVSIKNVSRKALLQRFSYASQKEYILQDTIRNNLTALQEDRTEDMLQKACQYACFDEVLQELSEGMETKLLQNGANLSGGQRKRLMLARAMAKQSQIYLFDEPYASLDGVTASNVRQNIEQELSQKTKVIVSSKLNAIRNADHILVLDLGQVVGYGRHEDLIKVCGIYKEMCDLQSGLEREAQ